MEYRYTQIVDTLHLIKIMMEHCDKIGMTYNGHRKMAERFQTDGTHLRSLNLYLSAGKKDANFSRTTTCWVKVFGWDLVIFLDDYEYAVNNVDDIKGAVNAYMERRCMAVDTIAKRVKAGNGSWSLTRLQKGELRDIQLNTAIKIFESLGGHIALRRPKRR